MKERPILFSAEMVRAILEGRKTQTRRLCDVFGEHLHFGKKLNEWYLSSGPYQLTHEDLPPWHWRDKRDAEIGDWAQDIQTDVDDNCTMHIPSKYGKVGDRLWVKETWTGAWGAFRHDMYLHYAADGAERILNCDPTYVLPKAAAKVGKWVTPLFMPRWASRITLEITDVRVQRLQDLTEEDAEEEGIDTWHDFPNHRNYPDGGCNCGDFPSSDRFSWLWNSINAKRGMGWGSNCWVWALTFKVVKP